MLTLQKINYKQYEFENILHNYNTIEFDNIIWKTGMDIEQINTIMKTKLPNVTYSFLYEYPNYNYDYKLHNHCEFMLNTNNLLIDVRWTHFNLHSKYLI